jgi:hypothetical protein
MDGSLESKGRNFTTLFKSLKYNLGKIFTNISFYILLIISKLVLKPLIDIRFKKELLENGISYSSRFYLVNNKGEYYRHDLKKGLNSPAFVIFNDISQYVGWREIDYKLVKFIGVDLYIELCKKLYIDISELKSILVLEMLEK